MQENSPFSLYNPMNNQNLQKITNFTKKDNEPLSNPLNDHAQNNKIEPQNQIQEDKINNFQDEIDVLDQIMINESKDQELHNDQMKRDLDYLFDENSIHDQKPHNFMNFDTSHQD